nr:hypothetical protein [Tanacetum cinerariifolium]
MINAHVNDLSSHNTKYTSLALTQKVFANIRRIGKGFSRADTPLFDGMLVKQQVQAIKDAAKDENDDNEVSAEPTPYSPTPATPLPSPTQEHIPSPPQAQTTQPSSPTCATLTKQVANLEQDKIAQAIKITKLKQRVRRLENKRQFKPSGLKRLRKVRTAQRVESSADTIMDDQEDASKQGEITKLDADEDVTLEDVNAKVAMDVDVQGRLADSQAKVYHLDLQHAKKFLSMQDTDDAEPAEVEEVIEVVTAAKLMTESSAPRRRRGVVIQDPEDTATASVIMHTKVKSKDKGKVILIKEPKLLKRQEQIEQDKAFARELEAELNANINWNDVMEQARKNMMKYLKNMVGFKMDFFKEKEIKEEGSKRKGDSLNQDAVKKQRIDEEAEELKAHLQIVVNDDDDVFTEATPLASKVPVVDYQIHHKNNKPYYKIIKADGTPKLFLSFITLLKNFNREYLEMLWKLVQERFQSLEPKNFSDDFLLNTFKIMFEKPNVEADI